MRIYICGLGDDSAMRSNATPITYIKDFYSLFDVLARIRSRIIASYAKKIFVLSVLKYANLWASRIKDISDNMKWSEE